MQTVGPLRAAVLALALLLVTATTARATPFLVSFGGVFDAGPVAGIPFFGNIIYNDLGITQCQPVPNGCSYYSVPILFFNFVAGPYQWTLADVAPGAVFFPTPASSGWGPMLSIKPTSLFLGLTYFGISSGASVRPNYTWAGGGIRLLDCGLPSPACSMSVSQLPPLSVPESSSLVFGLVGLATVLSAGCRTHLRRR